MKVQPYLMFNGRCEEAINFYKTGAWRGGPCPHALQGKTGRRPTKSRPTGTTKSCTRASRSAKNRDHGVGWDCADKTAFAAVRLSIQVKNEAEAARAFNGLSKGGR